MVPIFLRTPKNKAEAGSFRISLKENGTVHLIIIGEIEINNDSIKDIYREMSKRSCWKTWAIIIETRDNLKINKQVKEFWFRLLDHFGLPLTAIIVSEKAWKENPYFFKRFPKLKTPYKIFHELQEAQRWIGFLN